MQTAGVIVETVKRAEDGDGIIVRMYEAYKERKTVRMAFAGAKKAYLCDLNERALDEIAVEGNTLSFTIKPFEIITLKIKTV